MKGTNGGRPAVATRVAGAMLGALLLLACGGDDGDSRPEAQPTTDATIFAGGEFGDIPIYPRSDPLQDPNREDGVVSQSLTARGAVPEQVISFYDRALQARDWEKLSEGPIEAGVETARGEWVKDGMQLIVSATTAPTVGDDDSEAVAQYSLVLSGV